MLLKPSGWMRLAFIAGLAVSSLVANVTDAAEPVKIGLLEDASGNFALATIPKIHATQLAVDEINAKGGILGARSSSSRTTRNRTTPSSRSSRGAWCRPTSRT